MEQEMGKCSDVGPRAIKIYREVVESGISLGAAERKYGLSRGTIREARKIVNFSAAEITAAVEFKQISLKAACRILDLPKEEWLTTLDRIIEHNRNGRGQSFLRATGQVKNYASSPTRPVTMRMNNCIDQLENATELLVDFMDQISPDCLELKEWNSRISSAVRKLREIMKKNKEMENGRS